MDAALRGLAAVAADHPVAVLFVVLFGALALASVAVALRGLRVGAADAVAHE